MENFKIDLTDLIQNPAAYTKGIIAVGGTFLSMLVLWDVISVADSEKINMSIGMMMQIITTIATVLSPNKREGLNVDTNPVYKGSTLNKSEDSSNVS